jgi:hypothetical protein
MKVRNTGRISERIRIRIRREGGALLQFAFKKPA